MAVYATATAARCYCILLLLLLPFFYTGILPIYTSMYIDIRYLYENVA